uniref:Glia maturation factor beta n=1 Tax=Takifugu rubripes TaxID=31033 RepID=A0A674PHI3_TAKRU
MSESLVVCEVDEDLVKKLKEFRFRKETNNAAIIMKIDKDKQLVILEEEHEDISPDDLKDELPERQPRYPLTIISSVSSSISVSKSSLHLVFPPLTPLYLFSSCIPSLLNVLSLTTGTFIVYSYKYQHDDGRVSYPLCFIFSSPVGKESRPAYFCMCPASLWLMLVFPAGCRPEQQMMYAGSKNKLVHTVQLSKVCQLCPSSITINMVLVF